MATPAPAEDLAPIFPPTCGTCAHLADRLPGGVRYCVRWCLWREEAETPACGTHEAIPAGPAP
jgi:hypothetical protein